MLPDIIHIDDMEEDKRYELKKYLGEMWRNAEEGRRQQVDMDYASWNKVYEGIPLEKVRTVPFYKASNLVVKLARIYIDTFVARTLNIIFATDPLYVVDGLPRELKEGWELYLNRKALYDWKHYELCREVCMRGNRNGTVVVKFPWVEKKTMDVSSPDSISHSEEEYIYYSGPDAQCIPFEDFYVYPITINRLEDAEIKFHRRRFPREMAERMVAGGEDATWKLPEGKDLDGYLRKQNSVKITEQQSDLGVRDELYRELVLIECHFRYAVTPDPSKFYDVIALLEPQSGDLFDIYYNPYPRNQCIFKDYRPFPRPDFYYGESACQLLGMAQEECTRIHNERRDNSSIASSVVFKRRSGSLIPNPSTNWYPGKVFDLEDMQDLEVVEIGRNYEDMIQQEDYTFNQASQLMGISEVMQGASNGATGKNGLYNTMGTIAVMQEGNQRQDTNIRDVREVMGAIAQGCTYLQAHYGDDDPLIDTLPDGAPDAVHQALAFFKSDKARYTRFEVKASNAGVNKQVERANLLQMAQVLGQYGQMVEQMGQALANPSFQGPMRLIYNDIVKMHTWLAKRVLKEFDEWDAVEIVPDVAAAIETGIPGGSQGTEEIGKQTGTGGLGGQGGGQGTAPPIPGPQLGQMGPVPPANVPGLGAPNMGAGNPMGGGLAPQGLPGGIGGNVPRT